MAAWPKSTLTTRAARRHRLLEPRARQDQVLYYRNGLTNGSHTLTIKTKGAGNPYSKGTAVRIDALQTSTATGTTGCGAAAGQPPAGMDLRLRRWDWTMSIPLGTSGARRRSWSSAAATPSRPGGTWDPADHLRYADPGCTVMAYMPANSGACHGWSGQVPRSSEACRRPARNVDPQRRTLAIQINGRDVVTALDIAATAVQAVRAEAPRDPATVSNGRNCAWISSSTTSNPKAA